MSYLYNPKPSGCVHVGHPWASQLGTSSRPWTWSHGKLPKKASTSKRLWQKNDESQGAPGKITFLLTYQTWIFFWDFMAVNSKLATLRRLINSRWRLLQKASPIFSICIVACFLFVFVNASAESRLTSWSCALWLIGNLVISKFHNLSPSWPRWWFQPSWKL